MQRSMPMSKMLTGQGVGAKSQAARNKLIKRVVILIVVASLCALFAVWSRVRIVQLGYEMSVLQSEATELTKKVNHLKLEVERLKSPGRLQKVAADILGMHPPSSKEIVFVKKPKMK